MNEIGQKESLTMARFFNSAALLTLGLATAGCMSDFKNTPPEMVSNRSLYSENQPVVEHTNYVIDLNASGGGVPASELSRLTGWFDSLGLRYGDTISIDDPYASDAVREDVARIAARYGLLLSDGAPVTAGSVQPGSVRVVMSRATASVPGCPNWRQRELSGAPISTESNYGCAMNSNLAAMIANPNDLVLGQEGSGVGDAATASKAIKVYRETEPTGAQGLDETSTKEGN